MRSETVEKLLSNISAPVAHRKFKSYKNKPLPNPPYVIYDVENDVLDGSDDNPRLLSKKSVLVELHFREKDPELEAEIENALCEYSVSIDEDYIESEQIFVISYRFTMIEKIRR